MTQTSGIVRFEPTGPEGAGLAEWDAIDPATLVSGTPVQRGHLYHEDADAGYMTGVWDCTPQTERPGPYPVDEFMLLLEGSLEMGLPDGSAITVGAGQAFVIPKGLECQWRQPGYVRKFFMILDGPEAGPGGNPSLTRITVPPLNPPPEVSGATGGDRPGGPAIGTAREYFRNRNGRMTVTVRDCAALRTGAVASPANDLVHVVAGSVTLRSEDATLEFAPGDTFYLPAGVRADWAIDAGTRLLHARYAPATCGGSPLT